ncbi:MAG: alpha/beta fold hydrolase [Alphaproteobacteria bacterium]
MDSVTAASVSHKPTIVDARVVVRDGCAIATRLYGDLGAGLPRIALIHSLAMDRLFWAAVAEHLAGAAAILTYDCRGHGESDKPAGPYAIKQFADDLADVMNHFGWRNAAIAGASMGGCVALGFAAAYPARTAALGLIDTTAWYGIEAPKQWAERAERAAQGGMQALVEFQTKRWFGDAFRAQNPDLVARAVATFLNNDLRAYAATCEMLGAADLRAHLPALKMPAVVVVGEEDYATPIAMAEAMHRDIPGSELVILAGARHFTPLERPGEIAKQLRRLLNRIK